MIGDVEMEMIAVMPVGIWPQNRPEGPAGPAMELGQKPPVTALPPTPQNGHAAAVLHDEGRNIDSPPLGMFRKPRASPAVPCPAGVMRRHRQLFEAAAPGPYRR